MDAKFKNKKDAIKHLNKNPLACVGWGSLCAIYWNGAIRITKIGSKHNWMAINSS